MIKRTRKRQHALSEINIINLVDVILVLLIIFMLTAPYLQGGIEIELPKTRSSGKDTREGMIVSVTTGPAVYIEEDGPLSLEQLGPEIARRYDQEPGAPVYLRADQGVPYGYVVAVIALIKEAGFVNLGLVTEPLSENFMKRRS